jgi:hypothetical protein
MYYKFDYIKMKCLSKKKIVGSTRRVRTAVVKIKGIKLPPRDHGDLGGGAIMASKG